MSVQSEITKLTNNLGGAYDALEGKGATIPQNRNTDNLVATINSITGGGTIKADVTLPLNHSVDTVIGKPYYIQGDEGAEYSKIWDWTDIRYGEYPVGKCISIDGETAIFRIDDAQIYIGNFLDDSDDPVSGQEYNGHETVISVDNEARTYEYVILKKLPPEEDTSIYLTLPVAEDSESFDVGDAAIIYNGEAIRVLDDTPIACNKVVGTVISEWYDEGSGRNLVTVDLDPFKQSAKNVDGTLNVGTIMNGHELVVGAWDGIYNYIIVKTASAE